MKKSRFTERQIVGVLKQAEAGVPKMATKSRLARSPRHLLDSSHIAAYELAKRNSIFQKEPQFVLWFLRFANYTGRETSRCN